MTKPHKKKNLVWEREGVTYCYKFCSKCAAYHPFSEYTRDYRRSDGMYSSCKACQCKSNAKSHARRLKTDAAFRTLENTRCRIRNALRGVGAKSARTEMLLGCTTVEYQAHLDRTLPPGVTREECHVDHIIPCARYDLAIPEEQQKCFNFKNTQYLRVADNLAKGAKLPPIAELLPLRALWPANLDFPTEQCVRYDN